MIVTLVRSIITFRILMGENTSFARCYVKLLLRKTQISISTAYFSAVETEADFFNGIGRKLWVAIGRNRPLSSTPDRWRSYQSRPKLIPIGSRRYSYPGGAWREVRRSCPATRWGYSQILLVGTLWTSMRSSSITIHFKWRISCHRGSSNPSCFSRSPEVAWDVSEWIQWCDISWDAACKCLLRGSFFDRVVT